MNLAYKDRVYFVNKFINEASGFSIVMMSKLAEIINDIIGDDEKTFLAMPETTIEERTAKMNYYETEMKEFELQDAEKAFFKKLIQNYIPQAKGSEYKYLKNLIIQFSIE